jgi:hypothetical protein
MKAPNVEPIHVQEYSVKQSKYEVCGKLPIINVILGPSGSGKTVLLRPSIEVDVTWQPVKPYIENHMKVQNTKDEPI